MFGRWSQSSDCALQQAVWQLTLIVNGAIALLTGLSYARLGLAFRGDSGSFCYIVHAFVMPGIAAAAGDTVLTLLRRRRTVRPVSPAGV
ncbi:MAG: hypothetical protein ACREDY_20550 [Bradyrhizobium sp.]